MIANERLIVKDLRFHFRYVRPRALLALTEALAVGLIWLAADPDTSGRPPMGLIDFVVQTLPTSFGAVLNCAMSVYLMQVAYVTYWPCIREASIIIFDGRRINGFDSWGRKTSISRSEVTAVSYRYGGASVSGAGHKVWVPLSLLDTGEEYLEAIKALLNDTAD